MTHGAGRFTKRGVRIRCTDAPRGGTLKRTKGPDRLVRAPVQLMESVQLMNSVQGIDYPSAAMAFRMSSLDARQAGQMAARTPAIMDSTV